MVEEQINLEVLSSDFARHLAADEGEPDAQLNEKLAQVYEEFSFEVALLCCFRKSQEIEIVRIFDELLWRSDCGGGSDAWKLAIAFPWRR